VHKEYKETKKIYINKEKKEPPTQQGHKGKLLNSDEYPYTQTHHSKFPEMLYRKKNEENTTRVDFS
jgi:hypothetical protein